MNNFLEVKNLSKTYYTNKAEINTLDNISFKINDGDFIGIIGPSGAGKSTLLSILASLEKKTNGEIIKNADLNIGYMFQNDSLFPWLTIYDNCIIGLKINKRSNKEMVDKLLKTYDLYEFKDNYPKDLSGGMRQRVALIRTLVTKPDILLLDEPFSALDYQTRLKVSDDVVNIIKKEEKTLIIVTHDIREALRICNKILVFTKRPSKIKKIYDLKEISKEEFEKYYEMIWNDLNEE